MCHMSGVRCQVSCVRCQVSHVISCTLRSRVHPIVLLFRTFSHNWRTMIHFNVVLTVFHIDNISQGVCKTVRTSFQCIIILQSQGEGPEKEHNYGTDLGPIFRTFSPRLEHNDKLKSSSDSFAHTLRYVVNVENCQNYIEMYHCPPIVARRS